MEKLVKLLVILNLLLSYSYSINANDTLDILSSEEVAINNVKVEKNAEIDQNFMVAAIKSFTIIFVSEIADKSFITVLYFTVVTTKVSGFVIWIVASIAILLMCVLSIVIGVSMPLLFNKSLLEWVAIVLFFGFGVYQIYSGYYMDYTSVQDLLEIAQEKGIENMDSDDEDSKTKETELKEKLLTNDERQHQHHKLNQNTQISNSGHGNNYNEESYWGILWSMFTLVMLSEWGDKTMISTIVISSVFNVWGVFAGCVVAYLACNAIAVIAGKLIGKFLNEKIMSYIGGVIFIGFSAQYLIEKLL